MARKTYLNTIQFSRSKNFIIITQSPFRFQSGKRCV